jgi:hypothetical protein
VLLRAGRESRINVVEQRWANQPSTELVEMGRDVNIAALGGRSE